MFISRFSIFSLCGVMLEVASHCPPTSLIVKITYMWTFQTLIDCNLLWKHSMSMTYYYNRDVCVVQDKYVVPGHDTVTSREQDRRGARDPVTSNIDLEILTQNTAVAWGIVFD